MKTNRINPSAITGIIHGITAIFWIAGTSAAFAAGETLVGQVGVSLKGQELTHGKSITVDGGDKVIEASKLYTYEFNGSVIGERGTPAAKFIKTETPLAVFVESIDPGSSQFLKGKFSNPSGTLPATLFIRKISGNRMVAGLGNVTFGIDLLGKIEVDGNCVLEVTNVKFKATLEENPGSVVFKAGSKFLVSAAPVITFLRASTTVSETAESVTVPVKRITNQHGAVSVQYTTVPGTADSSDFTPTSGTIEFANREASKDIVIPIIDNEDNDGLRRFTIEISDPSTGAFLGSMTSTSVSIKDNE